MTQKIPCPFVYANDRQCKGHIVRIEAFGADLEWSLAEGGSWQFSAGQPKSHYHLYCSLKDNHSGNGRPDNDAMKFYPNQLPADLLRAMNAAER